MTDASSKPSLYLLLCFTIQLVLFYLMLKQAFNICCCRSSVTNSVYIGGKDVQKYICANCTYNASRRKKEFVRQIFFIQATYPSSSLRCGLIGTRQEAPLSLKHNNSPRVTTHPNSMSSVSRLMGGGQSRITSRLFAIQTGGSEAYAYSDSGRIGPPPDLPSLLMNERIIYVGLPLTPQVTELIIAQLLYLDYESMSKSITMYINSPGSEIRSTHLSETEALAVADVMNYISAPVHTICLGQAYGTAAMLLANGKRGFRRSLPNSTILIKQPSGGTEKAQASDFAGKARELLHTRDQIVRNLAKASGREFNSVLRDVQRNRYLTPQDAVEYGLIDEILQTPPSNTLV